MCVSPLDSYEKKVETWQHLLGDLMNLLEDRSHHLSPSCDCDIICLFIVNTLINETRFTIRIHDSLLISLNSFS